MNESLGVIFVRFLLHMAEVLSLGAAVCEAALVGVEDDIIRGDGEFAGWGEVDYLGYVTQFAELLTLRECLGYGEGDLFAHAVGNHIGTRITEDAGAQTVAPVVVMGDTAQRCLYAAEYDWHIGKELFEYLGIDDGGIFRTAVVTTVRRIGILRAQTAVGSVLVDHGVHSSWRYAKEQAWATQFFEVAEVAVPVGLRHYGHTIARCLEGTTYHCGTE